MSFDEISFMAGVLLANIIRYAIDRYVRSRVSPDPKKCPRCRSDQIYQLAVPIANRKGNPRYEQTVKIYTCMDCGHVQNGGVVVRDIKTDQQ